MTSATLNVNNHYFNDDELFSSSSQDKNFSKILITLLVVYLLFGMVVPFLDRVEVTREVQEKIPAQLAKIILKEKKLPPPEKPKPEVKEEPKLEELKPEKPIELPKTKRAVAKQKAASSGLAAMKDDLFAMRDAFDVTPSKKASLTKGNSEEVKVKRKLLASQANTKSQSLSVANVGKTVQSDALSSRNTQSIRLAEEEILAGSADELINDGNAIAMSGERSEVTLRRTLESSKSRLYALYNRALRKDPFLKGKVLFEIEIQADGLISKVTIKSSELNNKKLERQLTLVLKSIRFSSEEVAAMTTIWAIEFLPS
ncbi:MAG: AgmX/PglI C-terminal domain-containing protein [Methylococcales bacterium]|nr:AgmX/PglI C-terminal domain-containing protein [Methylococcales bacterium]